MTSKHGRPAGGESSILPRMGRLAHSVRTTTIGAGVDRGMRARICLHGGYPYQERHGHMIQVRQRPEHFGQNPHLTRGDVENIVNAILGILAAGTPPNPPGQTVLNARLGAFRGQK